MHSIRLLLLGLLPLTVTLLGVDARANQGLDPAAAQELVDAGVDKYLGQFTPLASQDIGGGWTKHTFNPDGGNGPLCIAGTPYSVFTRAGDPKKLLIFEQGGGACWQGFYNCNVLSEDQEPPAPPVGIWDHDNKANALGKYSIVYMPYCDGSVFSGDNAVVDPSFPFGPIRHHRGLRNQSAGMDVAKATFPDAQKVVVAGSSAGGTGVSNFAPFLVRFLYGNDVKISLFNDAGPVTIDLRPQNFLSQIDVANRAADWQFGQFFPASCTDCSETGQTTAIIKWRLDNDDDIREAYYETDNDLTNQFFLRLIVGIFPWAAPGDFRNLIVSEHGALNAAHPDRYKRFIVAGDSSHTALQSPLFYTQDANGVLLNEWTSDFLKNRPGWVDIVEDPVLP